MREIKFNDITDPFLDYNKVKKNISKVVMKKFYSWQRSIWVRKKLSKYVGSKFCVTTSRNRCIVDSFNVLKFKKSSEVITPAFSYVSSAEVILRLGLKPIFVDIDQETVL